MSNTRIIDLTRTTTLVNSDILALDNVEDGSKSVSFQSIANAIVSRTLSAVLEKIIQGTNVIIEKSTTDNSVTISAHDTTYTNATQSNAGLMSALDKRNIDNITTITGNTSLPTTATTITGAINEHETDINNINTDIGTSSMGTSATTIKGAIAEIRERAYGGILTIDVSAATGTTDGELYAILQELEWDDDVIE